MIIKKTSLSFLAEQRHLPAPIPPKDTFINHPRQKRLKRQHFFTRQKIDSLVSVVKISSAFIPITELPLLLSRGLHTATA